LEATEVDAQPVDRLPRDFWAGRLLQARPS
jgi:hypothetical protein